MKTINEFSETGFCSYRHKFAAGKQNKERIMSYQKKSVQYSLDIVNFDTVADAIYAAMQQYVERKPVNKESEYLNLENQICTGWRKC